MSCPLRVPVARVPRLRARGALRAGVAAAALAAGLAAPTLAGPSGGTVKGGQATIVTRGDLTIVRQGSRRVIIDWTSFDIGADEAVKFLQPGRRAVALNRVLDGLPTHIRGKLTANGNVWLVNPSGVMFHAGSVVDVGGLVATTADIDDREFIAGGGRFDQPGAPGARVVNEGTITFAEAGMVGLVAPQVANRGVIAGKMGKIVVAGQESFSVDVSGDGLFEIDLKDAARTRGARAETSGLLIAEGGTVIITAAAARDAVEAAVSVGGVVEARSAHVDGGTIVLDGGAGDVVVSGRLDASGAAVARGGAVDVTGGTVLLADGAKIDVSGGRGGGKVRVGGGLRGAGPGQGGLRAARVTAMEAGAQIVADATVAGDGGEVVLQSSAATWMGGRISARGAGFGEGGFAEISSAGGLGFSGRVDLSAPRGAEGLLLLDPDTVRIVEESEDAYAFDGSILVDEAPGEDLVVLASAISGASADVTVEAAQDISVEAAISNRRPYVDLTLSAGRDILLSASIVMRGDLTLRADADFASAPADGVGAIRVLDGLRLDSRFGLLTLSASEGLQGAEMAAGDLLILDTNEALTLPEVDLAGGLKTISLGPTTADAVSVQTLEMEARSLTLGGPATVAGETSLTTRGGAISALDAANSFGGAVSVDTTAGGEAEAGDVALFGLGDLALGPTTARALSVEAGGALSQTGVLAVDGASTLTGASIDLSLAGNELSGVVNASSEGEVALSTGGALRLGDVEVGSLGLSTGGGIAQESGAAFEVAGRTEIRSTGGAVSLTEGSNLFGGEIFVDASSDVSLTAAGDLSFAGVAATSLTLDAAGEATQSGALSLEDGLTVEAASVDFSNRDNDLGALVEVTTTGSASLADAGALTLGTVEAGALTLVAGGPVGQGEGTALDVIGATEVRTAGGAVALDAAGNLFGRGLGVDTTLDGAAAANVQVTAAGALALAETRADLLTVQAGGALTQSGALHLGAGADLAAISFSLRNEDNHFGDVLKLTGGAATLTSAGGMTFGASTLASLELDAGGDVGQVGRLAIAGTSRIEAAGDVILEAANAFDGAVSIVGEVVSITAADALSLVSVEAEESLTAQALDGDLSMQRVRVGDGKGALRGGADGGSISLSSALAGDVVLGGAEGDAAQDVAVDRAALGALQIAAQGGGEIDGVRLTNLALAGDLGVTQAPNVTLDGVALGTDAGFDPGAVTGTLSLHRVRIAGDLVASVQGDIRLGLVETTAGETGTGRLDLTSTEGRIAKLADADIDFDAAASGSGPLSILAPDGTEVRVAAAAFGPYADLLATSGDLRLTAAGDVLLPRAGAGAGALRARVGGEADLSAGGDLALAHAGDLTLVGLSVAGDAAISTVEGGDLRQAGAAAVGGTLALDVAGDARLARGDNAFATLSGRVEGRLSARDADGFSLSNLRAGEVSVAGQVGEATLRDVATDGDLAVEAASVSARRLEAGGDLALVATAGEARAADLQAAGELAMEATGDVTLVRFLAGTLGLSADGALSAQDGAAGRTVASAGGDATVSTLRLGAAEIEAGGDLSVQAMRAETMSLAAGGDVSLGGVAVTGDLSATAQGRIGTVSGPGELAAVTVAGVRQATVGVDADARLGEASLGRQLSVLAAGSDASLGAEAVNETLGVGGDARFEGRVGVSATGEPAAGVRIDGATTLITLGDARIETVDALVFAYAEVGGDLVARSNAHGGTLGGADITQTGAVQVGGHASFFAGPSGTPAAGDVTLDRADNAFESLSLEARNAAIRDVDGFAVTSADLAGRLSVGEDAAQAGPVSLTAISADGGAWVVATGDVSGTGLTLGAVSRIQSVAGVVSLTDLETAGLEALAGAGASLTQVSAEALTVEAGGDARLDAVEAGGLSVAAGEAITLDDVHAGTLNAIAGLGFAWTDVAVDGKAVGAAENGDAALVGVTAAAAEVQAQGDATVDDSEFGALNLAALRDATLRDVSGETLSVAAGVDPAAGASASEGDGTAILARVSADLVEVSAGADVRVQDSEVGRLVARAGRDGIFARLSGTELDSVAGGDLSWTDVTMTTAVGEATEGSATLVRGDIEEAQIAAGRDLTVSASELGSLDGNAGRDITLARLSAGTIAASAGRDLSASDVDSGAANLVSGRDMQVQRLAADEATLEAEGAMNVANLSAERARLTAAGVLDGTRIQAGRLVARAGGVLSLSDLAFDEARLTTDRALSVARGQGGSLRVTAGGGTTLEDLALSRLEASAGGALDARRIADSGEMALSANEITLTDVLAVGEVEALSNGDLSVTRLVGQSRITLEALGVARLDRVSAEGGLFARAEGAGAGGGPAMILRGVEAGRLRAEAGGALDLDGVATRGDATLATRSGDLLLGALEVGGNLSAQAQAGSIRSQRGASGTERWSVTAPQVPRGPAAPRDLPGVSSGQRVEPNSAVEAGDPTTVAGRGFDRLLRVAGDAVFDASGSVLLAAEDGGEGRDNDFRGGVGVTRARHVAISDANDLRIGAAGAEGLFNRRSGERLETVHLRAGGDVTDTAGARIRTSGDVWVEAGGDVRLDSGLHDFGGAFAARAASVEIATAGDLRLGPIQASGNLAVLAGASGEGFASIQQVGGAQVVRLGMADGAAADGSVALSGPIRVDGAADFATGADPAKTVVDKGADLVLDDPRNVFGGEVSIRRIFGAATLIEESAPDALHVDGTDKGWLRLAGFEAGGDVLIRTSDNVALLGRLTSLTDDMDPDGPLASPAAAGPADWRAQGGRLAQEDLRLFLPDGTVFAIDATAGGADAAGGAVRFDRPVDGANRLSSARAEDATAARGAAGALTIDAGTEGEVRFRDYVGASNPLGAVVIQDARDVSLGQTFAARDARPSDDPDRFLLQGEGQSVDIFTSGPLVVDARGAVKIYMPAGLLERYEDGDDYFGVNTPILVYGERTEPESLSLFGFIGDSGRKAAGLYPDGPRGVDFQLNGCVIGDVQDCTGISAPRILGLVSVELPEILAIDETDLMELFVSYGNEELWGVPDSYFEDSELDRARAETDRRSPNAPRDGGNPRSGDVTRENR